MLIFLFAQQSQNYDVSKILTIYFYDFILSDENTGDFCYYLNKINGKY